jgi:hypothetical protein
METTENICQNRRPLSQKLNMEPPEHETEMLNTEPRQSIK